MKRPQSTHASAATVQNDPRLDFPHHCGTASKFDTSFLQWIESSVVDFISAFRSKLASLHAKVLMCGSGGGKFPKENSQSRSGHIRLR
jgi:hypothetical protein